MEEFKAAVKRMQRYAGLNETGDFSDPRTLALVKANRCGVSDLGPSDNTRRKRRYALQGTYWRKNVSQLVCVCFVLFSSQLKLKNLAIVGLTTLVSAPFLRLRSEENYVNSSQGTFVDLSTN